MLRTYTYDTNLSDDPAYSQNALGRLTRVQYNTPAAASVLNYDDNWITFSPDNVTEMYSYSAPGQVVAKRLRVQRVGDRTGSTASADLNATWTYNNEGNLTGTAYPGDPNGYPAAPSYSYTYDGMGRLNGMGGSSVVSGVQYNAAGQMSAGLDTRTYNQMGQLTSISSGSLNVTYTYSTNQNIGKISYATYNGEQVSYTYDTLNRLIAAQAGSTWGQGFNYDPFGNLTTKYVLPGTTGSVPTLSVVPDAATNHLGGVDANGNATGYGINYDLENRLITASGAQYTYDGQNKRIFSCTNSCASETYYFYAPSGKLIAQFTPMYTAPYKNQNLQIVPATLAFQNGPTRAYFGSRLLGNEDRLGSRGKYFPYGEDNGSQNPASDNVKFATYTRDSATSLDYADQRYYSNSTGRFMTPDPYGGSGRPSVPQSWNRYAYVLGDPINGVDPSGLDVGTCGAVAYSVAMTGPPAACNTVGAAALSLSIDNWITPPTGLSQTGTIYQVDIAAYDEQAYGQIRSGAFWGALAAGDPGAANNYAKFSGGTIQVMTNPDPTYAALELFFNPDARLVSFFDALTGETTTILIMPDFTLSSTSPAFGAPLTLPFASTTTPSCSSGYHPVAAQFIPDIWTCAVNPTGPPPPPQPSATPRGGRRTDPPGPIDIRP